MLVDLEFNYEETTKAMDIFDQKDIDQLRDWIQKLHKSKNVPKDLTDKQLVLFYNACYGDISKTKQCIERYYKCKKDSPDLFNNRVFTPDFKTCLDIYEYSVLPAYSSEGYDIIFSRLYDDNVWKFNLINGIKTLLMTVDLCLTKRGPSKGLIFVFDGQMKLGHLFKINPLVLRRLLQFLQEAMPVRMQALHLLNADPILDKLMVLVKPFMNKDFYDKIIFHNKNEGLEKFYTSVPRSSLPPIYGGTLPDSQLLHKKCIEDLESIEPYFDAEERQRLAAL